MRRRIAHHVFTIISALSLLLCIAVCALWARGYWTADWFKYQMLDASANHWTGYALSSQLGTLYVSYSPFQFDTRGHAQKYSQGTQAPGFSHESLPSDPDNVRAFDGSFLGRRGFE